MRVLCSQEGLAPILRFISRITKQETLPLYQNVLLAATAAPENGQGKLMILGTGLFGMVGVLKHIPATVEREGQVLVPIKPFAEYVEALGSGLLTLSQDEAQTAASVSVPSSGDGAVSFLPQKASHLLQVERSSTNPSSRETLTNRANLTTLRHEGYPIPPIADWLGKGSVVSPLPIAQLLAALDRCVPCANEKNNQRKDGSPEMYGVLVHDEADAIVFSATTGTILLSYRIPLDAPTSFSFSGLFAGKGLEWIKKAFPKKGKVTLTLARNGQQAVLLVATPHLTVFCRAMELAVPETWEKIFSVPHEAEAFVERRELVPALAFFAKYSSAEREALDLSTEGTRLTLRHVPAPDDDLLQAQWVLQLARTAPDVSITVNPRQLKQIVKATTGTLLRLQIGRFGRGNGQPQETIGFLRILSGPTTVMMSLSRKEMQTLQKYTVVPSAEAVLTSR